VCNLKKKSIYKLIWLESMLEIHTVFNCDWEKQHVTHTEHAYGYALEYEY
jgi:hypothetical protein